MKNNNKTSVFERFRQYVNRTFHDKKVANGLYVSVVSIVFIALVIVVNLIVNKANITGDLTSNSQYSMSDDSKDYLKKLKEDIVIYYFTEPEYKDNNVFELVKKYEQYSKHVEVREKDQVQYPTLHAKFAEEGEESNSNNSVCVLFKKDADKIEKSKEDPDVNFKYIPYSSLVVTSVDYQTYQQQITGVDVEGQITSAINYLTSDISRKFYYVTGHNESEAFSSVIEELFSKQNFVTENLQLLTAKEVPEDCDMLVILAPQSDYMKEEITVIKEYLNKGKPVMLLTGAINDSLPNLNKLLKEYGLKNNESLVIDKDADRSGAKGSSLMYPIIEEHDITKEFNNDYIAMDVATGFTLEEDIDEANLTVTPLLKTSDRGYLVLTADSLSNVNSSNSKKGEYILGAVSEKALEDGKKARLIAYSASSTFDVNTNIQTDMYMNADLIMNSIYWACDVDESAAISIPSKSFESITVTMEGSDVIFIVLTFLILIPIIILVLGFVVWIRRRRR